MYHSFADIVGVCVYTCLGSFSVDICVCVCVCVCVCLCVFTDISNGILCLCESGIYVSGILKLRKESEKRVSPHQLWYIDFKPVYKICDLQDSESFMMCQLGFGAKPEDVFMDSLLCARLS